ncbi:hypothetical protein F5Y07DRAFT_403216 [Xylaria sp. FL0933]|nr:hypothetical protein F5Y07DRAFT_403216 [Xylaria sp. FL0933]
MGAGQSIQSSDSQPNGSTSNGFARSIQEMMKVSRTTGQSIRSRILRQKQCTSCFENKPKSEFKHATRRCKRAHKSDVCLSCLETWIRSSLENNGTQITCPQCASALGTTQMREFADRATYERWDTLSRKELLEASPYFVWCAHGCGSGQTHSESHNKMDCRQCHKLTCARHKIPWHSELTCQEFEETVLRPGPAERLRLLNEHLQQRARQDRASLRLIYVISKPCPRCGVHIQKKGGCNHMVCSRCRKTFLWGRPVPIPDDEDE